MAKQTINPGVAPTGAGGDTFRSGSAKLQANDDEIYNYLGDGTNLNKLGTAAFKNTGTQSGNLMEVGAFGLGVKSTLQLESSKYATTGLGYFLDKDVDDTSGAPDLQMVITGGWGDATHAFQLLVGLEGVNQIGYRNWSQPLSKWSSYSKIYHSRNTTVDGNGFVKAASPIIKLFANKIELNDEAQQQEIVFEKLGIGDYLITGSTGFAQEGWYVETPKDANGNVLFSVIYTSLENGDISVKTYKKKFDFETVSIVADLDNPVDITENRWIDLRLQELPQPEFVPPVSNTPASFQPTGIAQAVSEMMNGTEQ